MVNTGYTVFYGSWNLIEPNAVQQPQNAGKHYTTSHPHPMYQLYSFSQSKVYSDLAPLISTCCLTEETAWGFWRLYWQSWGSCPAYSRGVPPCAAWQELDLLVSCPHCCFCKQKQGECMRVIRNRTWQSREAKQYFSSGYSTSYIFDNLTPLTTYAITVTLQHLMKQVETQLHKV